MLDYKNIFVESGGLVCELPMGSILNAKLLVNVDENLASGEADLITNHQFNLLRSLFCHLLEGLMKMI